MVSPMQHNGTLLVRYNLLFWVYIGDGSMEDQLDYIQLKFLAVIPSQTPITTVLLCDQNMASVAKVKEHISKRAHNQFERGCRGFDGSGLRVETRYIMTDAPVPLPDMLEFDSTLHWPDTLILPPSGISIIHSLITSVHFI
jgi:hypothetical protein